MRTDSPRKPIPHIGSSEFEDLTFGSEEAVAHEFNNRLNVYGVDVDKHRPLFQKLRLKGLPHLVLFRNGEVKAKLGGFHPKQIIVDKLEQWLK
ncbi:thioredoxin family protein [Paenibacillus sp. BR2-3]|uniref:thioredoxin family protein n=1 Tax=Paenibacillus sp. BR2-3 TaxID=3048494 RepID=UPI003977A111